MQIFQPIDTMATFCMLFDRTHGLAANLLHYAKHAQTLAHVQRLDV